jgi:molecular chaperone GrpE (heat shock protein)
MGETMTEDKILTEQDTITLPGSDDNSVLQDTLSPPPDAAQEQTASGSDVANIAAAGHDVMTTPVAGPHEDTEVVAGQTAALQGMLDQTLQPVMQRLETLDHQLATLRQLVEQLARQQEFLPPQLRQLGHKVDDVATSIGDTRIRDLLKSFLLLHDLVGQMAQTTAPDQEHTMHRRNYEVLLNQILQVLQLNGIESIAVNGVFDPTLHRAVKIEAAANPAEDGRIVTVFRQGFRSPRMILRYAEVAVMRYAEPASVPANTDASSALGEASPHS